MPENIWAKSFEEAPSEQLQREVEVERQNLGQFSRVSTNIRVDRFMGA